MRDCSWLPDSRGIADSLPLTSLALDGALLKWGLFDSAMAKVGFYFTSFVHANGTIDMGHWKDKWAGCLFVSILR